MAGRTGEDVREPRAVPEEHAADHRRAPGGLLALAPLGAVGVAVLAMVSFRLIGREFYGEFRLPQGMGMYHLLPEEVAFYGMYFVFGGVAAAGLWLALRATRLPGALLDLAERWTRLGWIGAAPVALAVGAACALIGAGVLGHAVISDDEHVYQLIAQTLRRGSVTSPSPGADLQFFREQFVLLTPTARFGKYPIGHPLLLAAGQALGAEALVVPAVTAGLAAMVYLLGRSVGGTKTAALALLLFAASPHVLLTGATLLSQPAAGLCLVVALLFLLRAEHGEAGPGWSLAAGAALGFGVLCRPLPGVLFVPVAVLYLGWPGIREKRRGLVLRLALLLAPVAAAGVVILLVNRAQVGGVLDTAYGEAVLPGQGPGSILALTHATFAMRAMSMVGSLIRLNFWLFGWPISLLLCLAAPWSRKAALLWGMVLVSVVYRLLTPKVGVGGAGPVYFFEITAPLCVLGADGALALTRGAAGRRWLSPASMAALLAALTLVSASMFLPSRLADLRSMGLAQNLPEALIRTRGLTRALVFHEGVVPWWTRLSWAYYPRCNSPALDDDVLYVLLQRSHGLQDNLEFWKRRYPSRTAWYFGYLQDGPALLPLEDYVRLASPGAEPSRGVEHVARP
jgi:hypothetical protein